MHKTIRWNTPKSKAQSILRASNWYGLFLKWTQKVFGATSMLESGQFSLRILSGPRTARAHAIPNPFGDLSAILWAFYRF